MENILPEKKTDIADMDNLLQQIDAFEHEQHLLLALSAEITKMREKEDLIRLFTSRVRERYYFHHCQVMLVDQQAQTFTPFVPADDAMVTTAPHYTGIVQVTYPNNVPLIQKVLSSSGPISLLIKDLVNIPGLKPLVKIIYDRGVQELTVTPLRKQGKCIGIILLCSDRTDSFTEEFKQLLKDLAPQLSSALTNILIHEGNKKKDGQHEILRALSNDIAYAGSRSELLATVAAGLRHLIPFTQTLMTVRSANDDTYKIFLPDDHVLSRKLPGYEEVIIASYPIGDEGFELLSGEPNTRILDITSLEIGEAPRWLKLCYAAGAREMLIKILPNDSANRHWLILVADQLNTFSKSTVEIIDNIAGQVSKAIHNIIAHEDIMDKEREKSTLLRFGTDLSTARSKGDLEIAIEKAFKNLIGMKLCMIRLIEEDGTSLSRYIYDKNVDYPDDKRFVDLAPKTITLNESLAATSFANDIPVVFNLDEEPAKGRHADAMKSLRSAGLQNAFGIGLRAGNENIGILWLLTGELNFDLLKGLCSQIAVAIFNIRANERLLNYKRKLDPDDQQLKDRAKNMHNFSEIIGRGTQMAKVFRLMSRVAESNSTVLILGETGTGKELIARGIHLASPRKEKPMIKVNCAALPPDLIESELFGHEKGSFTGAIDRRIGKFELAHNGTIFLDEVGELPLDLQVKLLRVLQEREFERVGGKVTIKVNVRIIAATNRNLEVECIAGKFRADLYYRLNVFPIELPALRERAEDIGVLANFFLEKYSKLNEIRVTSIAPKAMQHLKAYLWPGNVRELEHVMERSILLANGSVLREVFLPKTGQVNPAAGRLYSQTIDELERSHIIETLKYCGGKISGSGGASGILEVLPTTLHSKMSKLNIIKADYME